MRRGADRLRPLVWLALAAAALVPFAFAAASPLLAGRDAPWVIGGLAGVLALCLLPAQPLLVAGLLGPLAGRRAHRLLGAVILGLVVAHVAGLWIYSPEDIEDALLLVAPTPFSAWGVAGLIGLCAAALLGALRRWCPPRVWKPLHMGLAALGALSGALHGWMIEGAMEGASKAALCLAVLVSLAAAALLAAPALDRRGARR